MLRKAENIQKCPLQAFPCIFWGGQLSGSEFQHNIAPLGLLRVNLEQYQPTSWLLVQPNGAISVYGPPTLQLFQSNRHGGIHKLPRPVEGILFLTCCHFLSVFWSFTWPSSCHMVTPDSLSCGFYHPYQIVFTLFDTSIGFRRVKGINLYIFQ